MSNDITTYLKYANLQMAAEALWGVSRILCKRRLSQTRGMRSSNWMVNRFRAAFQSRIGMVHF